MRLLCVLAALLVVIVTSQTNAEKTLMQPLGLTAEVLSSDSIRLTWEDHQWSDGSSEWRLYQVRYKPKQSKQRYTYINITQTEVEIDGLDPNVRYKFMVKTIQGSGQSLWSYAITKRTNPLDNVPPSKMRPFYTFARPRQIVVEWGPPPQSGADVSGYQLVFGEAESAVYITEQFRASQSETTLDNLEPDTAYTISLFAFNKVGNGPAVSKTVTTEEDSDPEPPLYVDVEVLSPRSVRLDLLDMDKSRPGRIYEIRWNKVNSSTYAYKNTTNVVTHALDLSPDQSYDFVARVYEGRRVSDWSDATEARTLVLATPPVLIAYPVLGDPSAVLLKWTDPKAPDGTPRIPKSYIGWYTDDTSKPKGEWELFIIGPEEVKKRRMIIRSLRPDTTYHFEIRPRGDSKNSSPLVAFTTGEAEADE